MNEEAIALLFDLVSIPSLSGEETAVSQHLVQSMARLGMYSFVDEAGNAVGIREELDENSQITNEIVLLGHMDTVPGDIRVRIEDDILHGRGSVDAKGPLATFVMAAAQADLKSGTRIIVIGAVEEESATSKGARFAATQYQPNYCIIGEPSGWDGVTLGYKGRILVDYIGRQPMAHTAGKEKGVAETAVSWWNGIDQYITQFNENQERLFDQLLPSIRTIQTDSDGLTNSAFIKVGIRLPPDFDIDAFKQFALELAGDANIDCYGYEPAYQSTRRTPLARAFNVALRQAEVRPRFKLKTGTSDMNVVGPIWNCPIVAYGPGDSNLDHTPEEHIVLSEYLKAIEVLKKVISNL